MKQDPAKLASLDVNQIVVRQYQENMDAQRVYIIGQDFSSVTEGIKEAVQEGIKGMKIELPVQKTDETMLNDRSFIVEKPVIVKEIEIREVEKPIIIKEYELKEVEKPVYIEKIKEIEKPVIVTQEKVVYVDKIIEKSIIPNFAKICLIAQTFALIGLFLIKLIK